MAISRRGVLRGLAALALSSRPGLASQPAPLGESPLEEFGHDQVTVHGRYERAQRENVAGVLMGLDPDRLLKPFREMAGQPAPGETLGGWYAWKPDYNFHHDDAGLAPASTFGQWLSALARLNASAPNSGNSLAADRVRELRSLLHAAITPAYFAQTRFPAYSLDKLVCGLVDAQHLVGDDVWNTLDKVVTSAAPALPGHAIDREIQWRIGKDLSWMWDESYTLPENLYRAAAAGAGSRYRRMAQAYLADASLFEPLSRGVDVLADKHAYSYVNALCSAMQAYFLDGSQMHLQAAKYGFAVLERQSFATGGWGPDETLRRADSDDLATSLATTHNSFEAPCGSYAHTKLTRYLLRATRDGHYGDSMERILYNAAFGVLPLQPDGRSFYSADYSFAARRTYSVHRWPCCSGTMPQVAADYGINTYLRGPGSVWVNLYRPSELRWNVGSTSVVLTQTGDPVEDGGVHLRIAASEPVSFTIYLRIPAWTGSSAALRINGRPSPLAMTAGFGSLHRTWRTGDLLDLDLPATLACERLPGFSGIAHPDLVAPTFGPAVLFTVHQPGDTAPIRATQAAILQATRTGPLEWVVDTAAGPRRMVPFPSLADAVYSTYLALTETALCRPCMDGSQSGRPIRS